MLVYKNIDTPGFWFRQHNFLTVKFLIRVKFSRYLWFGINVNLIYFCILIILTSSKLIWFKKAQKFNKKGWILKGFSKSIILE